VQLGFTEPYLFDKSIAVGADVFRRDYNGFNYLGNDRQSLYDQVSTGFQIRAGIPLTEYWSLAGRYQLSYDEVGLGDRFFKADGTCNPLQAGRYLCDSLGDRLTSSIGYSLINDSLNSRLRPTAGQRLVFSQDFAGLGGDVKYVRTRAEASKYWNVGSGFIFSLRGEGGYIFSLEKSRGPGIDKVRIIDRFYLGEPQFRGFDIRGVGPRVQRIPYTTDEDGNQTLVTDEKQIYDDALGGKAYYLGHAELEIPLGSGAQELGLRPSIFVDVGALFDVTRPLPTAEFPTHVDEDGNVIVDPIINPVLDGEGRQLYVVPTDAAEHGGLVTTCMTGYADTPGGVCSGSSVNTAYTNPIPPFKERFLGDSWKPRLSIGFGVNWNSPFGPLRIDIAKALLHEPGDDTKLITFNVGGQF
jgi:outer membrane protein insertion porin family